MKKNLLYLLTVMMTMMLDVGLSSCSNDNDYNDEDETDSGLKVQYPIEINAKNFPDDNFRKYLLKQDYGKDEILTEEEIKGIKDMDVNSLDIRSLKGIEHFTALKELICSWNQLAALDVSKNTALINLFCYGNQLTNLDVSKNPALTWLDCSHNQLTALNVPKNTRLEHLDCSSNQLTALDVSGCIALTWLSCSSNQLTALDVSGCTALTTLWCSYNQLTALDVSGCTALTLLWCSDNQLTALDVSGCTALNRLNCQKNQIKGTSMDNLIKSLPTQEEAVLYVYSSLSSDEGNVCTKEQVQAAKEKGWIVSMASGRKSARMLPSTI